MTSVQRRSAQDYSGPALNRLRITTKAPPVETKGAPSATRADAPPASGFRMLEAMPNVLLDVTLSYLGPQSLSAAAQVR